MLIIRAPFRVSFFGGGTDFYDYYSVYGGQVLSTTIDKYCYVTLRHLPPFFDFENCATYSVIERFNTAREVRHPLIRAALQYIPTERIQINYEADLPARSGIGSSSSFAVALLHGLHRMHDEAADRMTLAKEAIYLERELCAESGGVQDQIAAAFGGLNRIRMSADGFDVSPVQIPEKTKRQLQDNLILAFTGLSRFSGLVSEEQQKNVRSKTATLHEMKTMTDEALRLLESGKTDDFGRLLHEEWLLKRTLSSQITTDAIDTLYAQMLRAGAYGGKLLGAGNGGYMLLYVPAEQRESLCAQFPTIRFVPFAFEESGVTAVFDSDV